MDAVHETHAGQSGSQSCGNCMLYTCNKCMHVCMNNININNYIYAIKSLKNKQTPMYITIYILNFHESHYIEYI